MAEAYLRVGLAVYTGMGVDKRLDTEELLDTLLGGVNLRIDRTMTPCIVDSKVTTDVTNVIPIDLSHFIVPCVS